MDTVIKDIKETVNSSTAKQLGEFAFKRLQLLSAVKAKRNVESLKEQLREIEKSMVRLGWNAKAHVVIMTPDGPRVKQEPTEGIVIRAKPFQIKAHVNKYF